MSDHRQPMTPAEFDAACRALVRRCIPQGISCTSGHRDSDRNKRVGGKPGSKHLYDMARDYVIPGRDYKQAAAQARILGLWYVVHGEGANEHLHVQGLPPGDIPEWWLAKYWHD